jgi:hypothetical protein
MSPVIAVLCDLGGGERKRRVASTRRDRTSAVLLIAWAFAFSMACSSVPALRVSVPEEFLKDPPGWKSPSGEPEAVRYRRAFEAFWWNCLGVRAREPEAKCPSVCSGTPAAARGCADGASEADRFVTELHREQGDQKAHARLSAWAASRECRDKTENYFPDGPTADVGER